MLLRADMHLSLVRRGVGPANRHEYGASAMAFLRTIVRKEGVAGLWNGGTLQLRHSIGPTIALVAYDLLRAYASEVK